MVRNHVQSGQDTYGGKRHRPQGRDHVYNVLFVIYISYVSADSRLVFFQFFEDHELRNLVTVHVLQFEKVPGSLRRHELSVASYYEIPISRVLKSPTEAKCMKKIIRASPTDARRRGALKNLYSARNDCFSARVGSCFTRGCKF